MARSARRPTPPLAPEPAPRGLEPRTWQEVLYRPSQVGAAAVRELFRFAGAWCPPDPPARIAWEGEAAERLVGGVLVECDGADGFIHGPVVVAPPATTEPLEVAAQLVAAVLGEAALVPMNRLFARPQGLDRVWVRAGFVPMPEASLPAALRGRPGSGLHVWRRPGSYNVPLPERDAGSGGRR